MRDSDSGLLLSHTGKFTVQQQREHAEKNKIEENRIWNIDKIEKNRIEFGI